MLDQGVIVERGTHHQLLAKGGLYASMWNRQREAEAAREKLALVEDDASAPNRNPPPVEEGVPEPMPAGAARSRASTRRSDVQSKPSVDCTGLAFLSSALEARPLRRDID